MRVLHSQKLIFISKPRCGSTSIRNLLDQIRTDSDIFVDYAEEKQGLHPHMSLPSVYDFLENSGSDYSGYVPFIFIRNPLDMLWSYYKYFKPDINSQYNYSTDYKSDKLISFDDWLIYGRVGIGFWKKQSPKFINDLDFTPLSLEAHICRGDGKMMNCKVFKLEEQEKFVRWISSKVGRELSVPMSNMSENSTISNISESAIQRVRECFPIESLIYDI